MPQDYYFPNMVYMKNISVVLSELRETILENQEQVNRDVVTNLDTTKISK